MRSLWRRVKDGVEILHLPRISIDLMHGQTAGNDPFFAHIVEDFWASATRRHSKFPLVGAMTHGVGVCRLPPTFDEYFRLIEPAGHRNCRKAERLGYRFERIDYNRHLADIRAIRQSTDVRQGEVSMDLLSGDVHPCTDPPSRTAVHDYPHYGIVRDGTLWAYAGCLISGELCMVEHILGHAARLNDGIVPLLIAGIARELYAHHSSVRYYAYGTFFGGGTSLRRFKKKFGFLPHRVDWVLSGPGLVGPAAPLLGAPHVDVALSVPVEFHYQLVYRQERDAPLHLEPRAQSDFQCIRGPLDALRMSGPLARHMGVLALGKAVLKLASPSRMLYCVCGGQEVVHMGWVTFSRCRHYWVDPGSAVIGPVFTVPECRGKGIAAYALAHLINVLIKGGCRVFFIDTGCGNVAMQKVIGKCGFGAPVALYLRGRRRDTAE